MRFKKNAIHLSHQVILPPLQIRHKFSLVIFHHEQTGGMIWWENILQTHNLLSIVYFH
jgi:hypothetical protein